MLLFCHLKSGEGNPLASRTQPAHDVRTTFYGRCCDVKAFKQDCYNVVLQQTEPNQHTTLEPRSMDVVATSIP